MSAFDNFILRQNPYCSVPDCMGESVAVLYPHDQRLQKVVCQAHLIGWDRDYEGTSDIEHEIRHERGED